MFGFNQGELFLKNNLHKYDLCCVQEHWLYPSTLNDLANINPDFAYHAVSLMSNDDLISQGRPHGDLAVFWKKKLSSIVHYVGSSPNNLSLFYIVLILLLHVCISALLLSILALFFIY